VSQSEPSAAVRRQLDDGVRLLARVRGPQRDIARRVEDRVAVGGAGARLVRMYRTGSRIVRSYVL